MSVLLSPTVADAGHHHGRERRDVDFRPQPRGGEELRTRVRKRKKRGKGYAENMAFSYVVVPGGGVKLACRIRGCPRHKKRHGLWMGVSTVVDLNTQLRRVCDGAARAVGAPSHGEAGGGVLEPDGPEARLFTAFFIKRTNELTYYYKN